MRAFASSLHFICANLFGMAIAPLAVGIVNDALTPRFGAFAVRYSLLMMIPSRILAGLFLIWGARHITGDVKAALGEGTQTGQSQDRGLSRYGARDVASKCSFMMRRFDSGLRNRARCCVRALSEIGEEVNRGSDEGRDQFLEQAMPYPQEAVEEYAAKGSWLDQTYGDMLDRTVEAPTAARSR